MGIRFRRQPKKLLGFGWIPEKNYGVLQPPEKNYGVFKSKFLMNMGFSNRWKMIRKFINEVKKCKKFRLRRARSEKTVKIDPFRPNPDFCTPNLAKLPPHFRATKTLVRNPIFFSGPNIFSRPNMFL